MKRIGQTFEDELIAAGLIGLPITWDGKAGTIEFHEDMNQADIDAVNAVYDAHDPDAADFQFAKNQALLKIAQFAASVRNQMTGNADAAKLVGWNSKVPRAERIIASTASAEDTAIVQAEADKRGKGETVTELATKQLAKAKKLADAVSVIDGVEEAAIEAINDVTVNTVMKIETKLEELKTQAELEVAALFAA